MKARVMRRDQRQAFLATGGISPRVWFRNRLAENSWNRKELGHRAGELKLRLVRQDMQKRRNVPLVVQEAREPCLILAVRTEEVARR